MKHFMDVKRIISSLHKYYRLTGIVIFIIFFSVSQWLAYHSYLLEMREEVEKLSIAANEIRDKFKNIIYNDISASTALAIVYKEYGRPAHFDNMAIQIMKNSLYADAVALTNQGVITNIYPSTENNNRILGANVFGDIRTKQEVLESIARQSVFFSGPRKLDIGGEGIWALIPVIRNDSLIGISGVLTKLERIKREMTAYMNRNGNYYISLNKTNFTGDTST
ncbi:MAG: hypothetical protein AB7O73_04685, partial [Bacteroidia bacterium]